MSASHGCPKWLYHALTQLVRFHRYVYHVDGSQSYMQVPSSRRQTRASGSSAAVCRCLLDCHSFSVLQNHRAVGLKQPFLVLQVKVPSGQPFGLELGTTDSTGDRHRLVFSTSFRAPHTKALHAQFPLPGLPRFVLWSLLVEPAVLCVELTMMWVRVCVVAQVHVDKFVCPIDGPHGCIPKQRRACVAGFHYCAWHLPAAQCVHLAESPTRDHPSWRGVWW